MRGMLADKTVAYSHGKRKEYPDGSYELMCCSRPIFRVPGWEDHFYDEQKAKRRKIDRYSVNTSEVSRDLRDIGWDAPQERPIPNPENIQRAARRAVTKIRDYALCTDFKWFVTLTLDKTKIDRYDIGAVTKKLHSFLDNLVRREGLKYILVPEHHKDGAVHFHGFVNDVPGMVDSGTWSVPGSPKPRRPRSVAQRAAWAQAGNAAGYHRVFNWSRWSLGFSTAIEIYGERKAAIAYVCKYVSKQIRDCGGKIGGRWYYSGGDLGTPLVSYPDYSYSDLVEQSPDCYTFTVPLQKTDDAGKSTEGEKHLCFAILREDASNFCSIKTEFTKTGKSNAAGNGGGGEAAGVGLGENTIQKIGGIEDIGDNGIPSGQTGGAGSQLFDAGKSACHARGFTHGAENIGRSDAETGAIKACFLDSGGENGQKA